jgi:predicted benzoate:H+ symporter BenE
MWGVGSAFWGLVLGALALFIQRYCSATITANDQH